jgi:hypothetical protein
MNLHATLQHTKEGDPNKTFHLTQQQYAEHQQHYPHYHKKSIFLFDWKAVTLSATICWILAFTLSFWQTLV